MSRGSALLKISKGLADGAFFEDLLFLDNTHNEGGIALAVNQSRESRWAILSWKRIDGLLHILDARPRKIRNATHRTQ